MQVICAWCGSVIKAGTGEVSHGLCSVCYEKCKREVAEGLLVVRQQGRSMRSHQGYVAGCDSGSAGAAQAITMPALSRPRPDRDRGMKVQCR